MEENKKKVLEIMDNEWLSFYEKADAILDLFSVSQQRELLLSAICQFTKRNMQKEIQEVEKWIETDFKK